MSTTCLSTKFTAMSMLLLMLGMMLVSTGFASDIDNEQQSRMKALKYKATQGTLTVGDMHEIGEHVRIAASRLRDTGKESTIDGYLRSSASTSALLNKCMQTKKATLNGCKAALAYLRNSGTHKTLQDAGNAAHSAYLWGSFTPTMYTQGAWLRPIMLPNCNGVRMAIDVSIIAGSAMMLFPSAQGAGGITLLFGGILMLAADRWC